MFSVFSSVTGTHLSNSEYLDGNEAVRRLISNTGVKNNSFPEGFLKPKQKWYSVLGLFVLYHSGVYILLCCVWKRGQPCPVLPSCMRSSIPLVEPSWTALRSLSSVQSVSSWRWWLSSLAEPTVLTLRYALYALSLSVRHELSAGASIWNRPI